MRQPLRRQSLIPTLISLVLLAGCMDERMTPRQVTSANDSSIAGFPTQPEGEPNLDPTQADTVASGDAQWDPALDDAISEIGPAFCGNALCEDGESSVNCASDCGSLCGDGSCNGEETGETCNLDCTPKCGDAVCDGDESTNDCPVDCGTDCGDDACNGEESHLNCAQDCGSICGDDTCNGIEGTANCPQDCGSICGDGTCNGDEGTANCHEDCGSQCGDSACNGAEESGNCAQDCGSDCGDQICNGSETTINCAQDCGANCGDLTCNGDETTSNCPQDCGATCGDGACNGGETSSSCADDCGSVCGDNVCNGVESTSNCFVDCGTDCGDGACNGGETANTCSPDCGAVPPNSATFESQNVPTVVGAGETFEAQVTFRNMGTNSWSLTAMHFLGSDNPQDNFTWSTNRMWMDPDTVVPKGSTYTFSAQLIAPDTPGSYNFQWRMLQDAVEWFGESSSNLVIQVVEQAVDPVADYQEPDPPNLSQVTWLHTNVSGWPVTANLSSVSVNGDKICLNYNKAGAWPIVPLNEDVDVVANPWVFIHHEGGWYAATWEWLRPNQTCKNANSVAGDHIKKAPFNSGNGWKPHSGEVLYFMVSGLARIPGIVNVSERSNLVKVVWP